MPQYFSKSSMNRFFFMEVLQHVLTQINDVDFRRQMGNAHVKRTLSHVVVTCPTGMMKEEQATLRRYAEEAGVPDQPPLLWVDWTRHHKRAQGSPHTERHFEAQRRASGSRRVDVR